MNTLSEMKNINMRFKISFLLLFGVLFSCTPQMQLVTLKPTNPGLDEKTFVYQDSLIKVTYDFYSPNGALNYRLYNKSQSPIFIDWKNSMYIASSDKKYAYWNDESNIDGQIQVTSVEFANWLSSGSGTISGTIKKTERITFLPSNTEIRVSKFKINGGKKFVPGENKEIISEKNNWEKNDKTTEILLYKYTADNSPLNFRNYLTISTTEDFKNPKYYDFGFWISGIQEMSAKQLVGDFLFKTNMDSINSKTYHPYKGVNRFFVKED